MIPVFCWRRMAAPIIALLIAAPARAEKVEPEGRSASHHRRIYGASFLKPLGGGVASVGGFTLRYLPAGARKWRVLHWQKGNLYWLGLDPERARLLAVWERDSVLHYFDLRNQRHMPLPLPAMPPPAHVSYFEIHSLAFAPSGREA